MENKINKLQEEKYIKLVTNSYSYIKYIPEEYLTENFIDLLLKENNSNYYIIKYIDDKFKHENLCIRAICSDNFFMTDYIPNDKNYNKIIEKGLIYYKDNTSKLRDFIDSIPKRNIDSDLVKILCEYIDLKYLFDNRIINDYNINSEILNAIIDKIDFNIFLYIKKYDIFNKEIIINLIRNSVFKYSTTFIMYFPEKFIDADIIIELFENIEVISPKLIIQELEQNRNNFEKLYNYNKLLCLYMNEEFITNDIILDCIEEIANNSDIILDIPDKFKTKDFYLSLVKNKIELCEYVPDKYKQYIVDNI